MKIMTIKDSTMMMGLNQKEYMTVPMRAGMEIISGKQGEAVECPNLTASFKPTPEELERLNQGATIHLTVLGSSWAPMRLVVQNPPVDPNNPDDTEYVDDKGYEQGLQPGQFLIAWREAGVYVSNTGDKTAVRTGDILLTIDGEPAPDMTAAYAAIALAMRDRTDGVIAPVKLIREGRVLYVQVAMTLDVLDSALAIPPEDLGPVAKNAPTSGTTLN